MRTRLVIAGNSFIGRAVCTEWGDVMSVTRQTGGDLLDGPSIDGLIARCRPDAIVSCAGATGRGEAGAAYALHVDGTLHLLEAVRRHVPDCAVVLLGSAAEYGEVTELPTSESAATRPTTFYGASKLAQTQLADVAAREWGLRLIVARLFNVIGPALPERYFLAALARRLRSSTGDRFAVDNLTATRDFLDVRDAARALVGLTTITAPGVMEVFNVASGEETSLAAAAGWLGELAGGRVAESSGRTAGVQRSCGDIRKLKGRLGWQPQTSWRESIADLWNSLESG